MSGHNSRTNDPKVLKLDNDLGISRKWYGFGLKGQRVTVTVMVRVNTNICCITQKRIEICCRYLVLTLTLTVTFALSTQNVYSKRTDEGFGDCWM